MAVRVEFQMTCHILSQMRESSLTDLFQQVDPVVLGNFRAALAFR